VTYDFTRKKASQSAAWAVFARDTVSGFITTAHHTLLVLGIIAIAALAVMFVKPEIADQLKELSPFVTAKAGDAGSGAASALGTTAQAATQAAAPAKDSNMTDNSKQQQRVTSWLSKRYRVANDAIDMLVSAAYMTAKETKLDPLLILSVIAIESRFNPFAESPVGAQGLMQVMSKVHHDKFEDLGGIKAALNPVANIKVGSLILKDYVRRGGSIEAGLKLYVGAGAFDTDWGYGAKVLAEYHRLKDVAMGKNVPVFSTSGSAAPVPVKPRVEQKAATTEEAPPLNDDTQPLAKADQTPEPL
jgi:soluble lytic murein transglycosylase-like protein